jgi:hypothetical protein
VGWFPPDTLHTLTHTGYSPRAASSGRSSGEVNYYSKIYSFSDLSGKIKIRWLHKSVFHHSEEGPRQSWRALDSSTWSGACSGGLYAELEAVEGGASDDGDGVLFREDALPCPRGGCEMSRMLQSGHA